MQSLANQIVDHVRSVVLRRVDVVNAEPMRLIGLSPSNVVVFIPLPLCLKSMMAWAD
jgi:hypothetical protein